MLAAAIRALRHPPDAVNGQLIGTGPDRHGGRWQVALIASVIGGFGMWLAWPARLHLPTRRPRIGSSMRGLTGVDALIGAALALPLTSVRLGPANVGDALLVVALVMAVRQHGRMSVRWARTRIPAVVILGAGLALVGGLLGGALGTPAPFAARPLLRAAAGVGVPLVVIAACDPSRIVRRQVATAFAAGAAASVLFGVVGMGPGERIAGLATHPNHLGLACVLGVAMAMGAQRAGADPRLIAPVLLVDVVGVLLSGSRSALLGLALVGTWWAVVERDGRRGAPRVAGAAIILLTALWHGAALDRVTGDPASDAGHRFRFEVSVDRVERAPLTGEGFRFLEEAHSVPLQLLAAGGPLTFAGGGVLLVAPLVLRRGPRDPMGTFLKAGWTAYLAGGLVQNILVDRYVWFVGALLLAEGSAPLCPRIAVRQDPTPNLADGPVAEGQNRADLGRA
jgi:hypothetical protein